jgi:hypothetical protein
MSNRPSLAFVAACAAVLISLGAAQAAAPSPGEPCRSLSPRYEPKAAHSPQTDIVRWLGGAKLSRPVATPCPPSRRPVDA